MQKFKYFIKYSFGYIVIISVSLVSLYFYLEHMPAIRHKKEEAESGIAKALESSLPYLAFAENKAELARKHSEVAGVSTEKKELVYVTQKGDYLWRIAQKYYGDGFKSFDIAKANNLSDIDNLNVGQNIKLPNVYDTSTQ